VIMCPSLVEIRLVTS